MTREQLNAELDAIAQQRASGADYEDVNELISALARRSGFSFAFVRSNTGKRMQEIRAAWWRAAEAVE